MEASLDASTKGTREGFFCQQTCISYSGCFNPFLSVLLSPEEKKLLWNPNEAAIRILPTRLCFRAARSALKATWGGGEHQSIHWGPAEMSPSPPGIICNLAYGKGMGVDWERTPKPQQLLPSHHPSVFMEIKLFGNENLPSIINNKALCRLELGSRP